MGARLLLGLLLLVPLAADAQRLDEVPLEDILQVLVLDREIFAIDAVGGGQLALRLEIGEQVLFARTRGRVGVVLTDRRVLAVTNRSAAWQQERYRAAEVPQTEALLGDRVALVTTSQRVLGFDGGSGNLIAADIGPREVLTASAVGGNVVAVVTSRRALGLSPRAGGFFPIAIQLGERIESVTADSNFATVVTSRRILVFQAPSGAWVERRLNLD
ncbi:MAG: hypothetical protein JSU66_00655 [Deltaproteobacteria bacterium]|nr:MAG: hypothetical protein JSU66_00655 [Deltaproteobacteria bacterium]